MITKTDKLLKKLIALHPKYIDLSLTRLETLLKKLKLSPLPILKTLPPQVKVILVDHNDPSHSFSGLPPSQIIEVVDHHRITLRTKVALAFHTENIGSTASLIYKKFLQKFF